MAGKIYKGGYSMDIYESMVKQCSIINFVIDSANAVIDTNLYTMKLLDIYDAVGREFFSFLDRDGWNRIKKCVEDGTSEPVGVNLIDARNNAVPATIVANIVGGYLVVFGIENGGKEDAGVWNGTSDFPVGNDSDGKVGENGDWQQNYIDAATGLYNMKFFQRIFPRRFEEANDSGDNLGIMMISVDGIDLLRKRYGEDKASGVLSGLSQVIMASIRNTDYAIRYGEAEILLLLSTVKENFLPVIGARIREGIAAQIGVQISIGCTSMATSGRERSDSLISNAERALKLSKEQGSGNINVL